MTTSAAALRMSRKVGSPSSVDAEAGGSTLSFSTMVSMPAPDERR
ncbi:hypothetical protein [Actinopolyspora xinjiangensis]|nr:hypothetical protein [Actinopolyspora xinjiangensis]